MTGADGAELYGRTVLAIFSTAHIVVARIYKNSSGDEIANVLVNDDIAHT